MSSEVVASDSSSKKTFDPLATLSYVAATGVQITLIITALHILQIKVLKSLRGAVVPLLGLQVNECIVTALFMAMSLRSRVFSPLTNSRPSATKEDPVFKERLRPSWMPPPLAFPIIWSIISVLRTISSLLVYKTTGSLLCPAIFWMMAHLCIGDTWNTINNVDNRLGSAFGGVLFVWGSVLYTTYQYYLARPLAGLILAPSAVWLSVASFLVYSIWQLNKQKYNYPSLLPSKEEGPSAGWRVPMMKF